MEITSAKLMYEDVVDLRDWYQTRLGRVSRRMISLSILSLWPNVQGLSVLGLGYPTPYMQQFVDTSARAIACMPSLLGVVRWPEREDNRVTIVNETSLPLPSGVIDRVLVVHGIERSEQTRAFLREIWRILSPNGRLLVVTPNRHGIWARLERTPFGNGSPYTVSQLSFMLRDALFIPERVATALYVPPSTRHVILSSALAWEKLGRSYFSSFAGVILIEAVKQTYMLTGQRDRRPALAASALSSRTFSKYKMSE